MWPQRDPHQACPPCLSIICHVSHVRHVPPHVNPPHRPGSESGQDKVCYQCLKSQRRWLHSSSSSRAKTNPTDRVRPRESYQLMFLSTLASLFFSSSSAQANIHHDPQSKPHVIGDHLQQHIMISSSSQAHSSLPHGLSLQPTVSLAKTGKSYLKKRSRFSLDSMIGVRPRS